MDVAITNTTTAAIFIPGPNIEVPASGTVTWSNTTMSTLDGNKVLKAAVVAGTLTVVLSADPEDAAVFDTTAAQMGLTDPNIPSYTVANLPASAPDGTIAYATNGRAGAEGAAAGTGTPVVMKGGTWLRFEDLAAVAA